ncbi:MAG: hypothetical protein KAT46_06160 [Deltaproteobacteria bacterium]|nr:hypothetical protein [Deltaproteobacteria bacterium]
MIQIQTRQLALFIFTILALTFYVFVSSSNAAGIPPLTKIDDLSLICMVNDRNMHSPQIPVEVNDKIYYGCCAGCVSKLTNNKSIREGKDPVTGSAVDKATAIAVNDKSGAVFYFESEETMEEFMKISAEKEIAE